MSKELFDYDNYIDQDFPDVEDKPITTSVDDDFADDKAILDKKNKIQESAEGEPQWTVHYYDDEPSKVITGLDAFYEAVDEAEEYGDIQNIFPLPVDEDDDENDRLPSWTEEEGLIEPKTKETADTYSGVEDPRWEIQYFDSTGRQNKVITGWDAFEAAVEEAENDWEINNIWAIGPDKDKLPYWTEEEGLHEDLQETVDLRKKPTTNIDFKKMQEDLEDNEDEVECAWCFELYPKKDCVKEVDLGWLCPYCKQAIESRGEKLTFTNRESLDECGDQPIEECGDAQLTEEDNLEEANAPKLTDEEGEALLKQADEIYAKYDGDRDYYYMKYLFDMCAELNDEGEAFITSATPSEFERKANDVIEYIPVWRTHDATDHRLPIKGQPIKHGGKLFNKDGTIKKIEIEKNPKGYEDYWRLYVVD